jgi:hypothetical protein
MKQPLRTWMTGCLAVVSLALGAQRAAWALEPAGAEPRGAWKRSSHGLAETVQRLEASAQRHGLAVLARWLPPALPPGAGQAGAAVLVFESHAGGTPVRMGGDGSQAELPLSLCIRSGPDGRAEVLLPEARGVAAGAALPQEVLRELNRLPGLVADALA